MLSMMTAVYARCARESMYRVMNLPNIGGYFLINVKYLTMVTVIFDKKITTVIKYLIIGKSQ